MINERNTLLEKLQQDGNFLYFASEELKDDEQIVQEAVKRNGKCLQYASNKLKDN